MTEDIQAPASMSEFNRNTSSEKPQLQVIDIIDQLANSSEILPCEITAIDPSSSFVEENQEGTKHLAESSVHHISDAAKELQGKPEGKNEEKNCLICQESTVCEEESRDGLHEKIAALNTKEFQGEESIPSKLPDENIDSLTETEEEQGKIQLNETSEPIEEETLLEDNESITEEDWEGPVDESQQENSVASHKKGQENNNIQCLPTSPSCTSQTEEYDDQPGALKKNDISRHSYSRYNTISYRKIRKGNTKQRIDEFESMMHS
ncbi:ermin [Crotalus adamanteus]|uniref:Ermin n=1 Tax=Crotalus adamanteus TaxID=8729 RepID=A0AAW1C8J8_CROAD